MNYVSRLLLVGMIAVGGLIALAGEAQGQVPVAVTTVQPVVPGVVGYLPERRGLFGQRIVYRPVVAPTVAAPAVTVTQPLAVSQSVAVARPVTTVAQPLAVAPTVTVARPVIAAPVVPVRSFFAPAAPVAVPVTTYRIPVTTYVPAIGY